MVAKYGKLKLSYCIVLPSSGSEGCPDFMVKRRRKVTLKSTNKKRKRKRSALKTTARKKARGLVKIRDKTFPGLATMKAHWRQIKDNSLAHKRESNLNMLFCLMIFDPSSEERRNKGTRYMYVCTEKVYF